MTKPEKSLIIFDTANVSTTTASAGTRKGCQTSSPQCQRAAAAAALKSPSCMRNPGEAADAILRVPAYCRAIRWNTSACVGYQWTVSANTASGTLCVIARVSSLIISPACAATSVASIISPVPRRV